MIERADHVTHTPADRFFELGELVVRQMARDFRIARDAEEIEALARWRGNQIEQGDLVELGLPELPTWAGDRGRARSTSA